MEECITIVVCAVHSWHGRFGKEFYRRIKGDFGNYLFVVILWGVPGAGGLNDGQLS